MAKIVTHAHRYKRPPRKRKAQAALAIPTVVKVASKQERTRQSAELAKAKVAAKPTIDPSNDEFFTRMMRLRD
jgi:hypothetical protein